MKTIFNTIFFQPLYNALAVLANTLPGHSLGLSIIALTVAVRALMLPFTKKASDTQLKLKAIEPKLKEIKEKYPKREEQSRKILELYKEHEINPFGGLLPIFIQIPILFALFFLFKDGLGAHVDQLYSFVTLPSEINYNFLGLDLAKRSVLVAVLLFATQFSQAKLTLPGLTPSDKPAGTDFKADFARSMQLQMLYVLPVMIALASLSFPAAVGLYWLTGNIFTITYELIRRRLKHA